MRHKIKLDIILADRSHHIEYLHVNAVTGDAAAALAQDAVKRSAFYKMHVNRVVATHVIGVDPDPEADEPPAIDATTLVILPSIAMTHADVAADLTKAKRPHRATTPK